MTARRPRAFAELTSEELRALVAKEKPLAALLPVGSVEPHGPHLSLATDIAISEAACARAASRLEDAGIAAAIAPAIPYGVTECASRFPGAISIPEDALIAYLGAVIDGLLGQGVRLVCAVNNHLEPGHDRAVRAAVGARERAIIASPLDRRWARTLSEEFRRGACHAGRYETSIALAWDERLVRDDIRRGLPAIDVSLSERLAEGVSDFVDMGLSRAYAGAPAEATAKEGDELLDRLATMIVTEVRKAIERS